MSEYIWDMTDEEIEEEYWNNRIKQTVAENSKAIALKMLQAGKLSYNDIAEYSNLPIEEVMSLNKN